MSAVSAGINDAMGMGGKGGFGQPLQDYQQTQATQGNPNLGIGFGMPAPVGIQGNQPAPDTLPSSGMGGGKSAGGAVPTQSLTPQDAYQNYSNVIFGGGDSIFKPNFMPQGPQIGFGPAPIQQNPMDMLQQPQPVNRFAPPNAPGVRQQPRTAPRAGVPVQQARTVRPNTRTRLR
jgi:hypothetical protein